MLFKNDYCQIVPKTSRQNKYFYVVYKNEARKSNRSRQTTQTGVNHAALGLNNISFSR